MAKSPAFQFYASDWLGSTKRAMMTPAQRGAYIDLLCHQWGDDTCSLDDDDEVLAALSGLNEGWFNGGSVMLRKCFPPHPSLVGRIANPRMLELRSERTAWEDKSRAGGIKSGVTRRLRSPKGGSTTVRTNGQPKGNTPSPSPSPSPSRKKRAVPAQFVPPTVEEVRAYCLERKNSVDPQGFVDFYTSKGWMVGKNSMKDWKAAVRTWEKNQREGGQFAGQPAPPDTRDWKA